MKKAIVLALLLTGFIGLHAQSSKKSTATKSTAKTTTAPEKPTVAKVDKKTKEFIIPSDTKSEFRFYGFQFPNESTKKMICFSSNRYDVAANIANCPLGSYYNTGGLNLGAKIIYLGKVGNYGKMNFIDGAGKKTLVYIQNSNFTIK